MFIQHSGLLLANMLDQDAGQTITEALSQASRAVQELISFRNQFLGPVVDAYQLLSPDENDRVWQDLKRVEALVSDIQQLLTNKSVAMKDKFDETVSVLRSVEPMFARASLTEKAQFCYLNGKALNAIQPDLLETTDESIDLAGQASQWLKRALKYNPQLVDAWCELGESSWRLGDPGEASNHFRQALKIEPDHVEAMCQLSMVLRQLPRPTEKSDEASARKRSQESDPFAESVHLAHEAVRHQPTNGHAWSILGNALLSSYFNKFASIAPPPFTDSPGTNGDVKPDESGPASFTSSQLIMTRCIAAYAQAAKDRETALEPNFHFNRGFTWHSQDMFALCLRSWLTAICLDPQWSAPRIKALRLTHFLLELGRCLHQIKQELCESAVEQETGDENVQLDRLKKSSQRPKRDSYHVRELITPLAPCLSLVENSQNDIEPEKNLTQRRALARLLGPYCPSAAGDPDAASILSGITVKIKKSKRVKSKQPSMISPSPFSPGANSWKLRFALFDDLQVGTNRDKVCVGRVVTQLPSDTDAALNLLLVDAKGTPLPVRLCNIGKGLGPVRKDILAIPHPFIEQSPVQGHLLRAVLLLQTKFGSGTDELTTKLLSKLQLTSTDHTDEITNETTADTIPSIPDITYSFLRIPLPDVLVVNGQPVGGSWTAVPVLQSVFFSAV
ncbi:Tetratricopeptide repeat protein 5 [Clonorchis sinensis]|uniref:Tetratricopeptide repeat protein 5 n=1 Tax=Clonorchis sinensis TaxID=79923 RepID=A0A8T1N0D8_CLOSI|nr:Tetratricopeptide repeat protein 5 [Clonorchis sinensis]